ncbi:MAG: mobilization protein [Bacteroidales bacterium 45-6]|uniref:conjugal transfer protein MobB n=1 Tax=uncultured Dysgonomonas sp. TaxID=206096 RepID=UPI00095E29D1|nr:conjugal transfer protein MobB [uncultured Dysgonomonas sp.]OJU50201.1 MAG: mobilization protein [Bacteroidales bacterium 45-6]
MVADIHIGNNLYGALAYNQEKIDAGLGKILEANRVFVPADGQFSVGDCMRDFERAMPPQVATTRGIIHISLNPHPEDKITDDQLTDIGREYIERLGFGGQPYMIFKHEDIDRWHLHIVSTRVRSDGSLISDKNNYEKSKKITDDLEQKYGLHPKDKKQGEVWRLSPVDASRSDLKKQVANAIKPLTTMYKFQSLGEFRALLSLYNIGVEKIEGDNQGHKYTGLVYSALDADGNRIGKPLKSSLFGKSYGIEALEQMMKKFGEEIKTNKQAAKTKTLIFASLNGSCTGREFRADLQNKGIDLVLRYGNGGRLFGVTFIDHNSRTVLNGSALGKEFSANALGTRFADFAMEENQQPVLSIPQKEALRPLQEEKQPTAVKGYSGDDSPVGSLFSVLTPELDQHDANEPMPKKHKRKKRRYGRQM